MEAAARCYQPQGWSRELVTSDARRSDDPPTPELHQKCPSQQTPKRRRRKDRLLIRYEEEKRTPGGGGLKAISKSFTGQRGVYKAGIVNVPDTLVVLGLRAQFERLGETRTDPEEVEGVNDKKKQGMPDSRRMHRLRGA